MMLPTLVVILTLEVVAVFAVTYCGLDLLLWMKREKHGNRRAAAAAHGDSDASAGDGAGARAASGAGVASTGKDAGQGAGAGAVNLIGIPLVPPPRPYAVGGIAPAGFTSLPHLYGAYPLPSGWGWMTNGHGQFAACGPNGAIRFLESGEDVERLLAELMPIEQRGITVGAFVGWRIWRVCRKDRLLMSYWVDRVWKPGEPMEGCPSDWGPEGVWAFTSRERAIAKVRDIINPLPNSFGGFAVAAVGSVLLWGDVVEHRDGYRAQFAELNSLEWAGPGWPSFIPIGAADAAAVPAPMIGIDEHGTRCMLPSGDDELLAALRQRYGVSGDEAQKKSAGRE